MNILIKSLSALKISPVLSRRLLHTRGACLCEASKSSASTSECGNSEKDEHLKFEDEQPKHREADEKEAAAKQRILEASLDFVSDHGWTRKTLAAGAEVESLPGTAHGLFPRGGIELVLYFYATSNEDLVEDLIANNEAVEKGEIEKTKISVFIRDAVEARLRMMEPYLETWPQAIGLMALPQNAPDAFRNLRQLVDDIWYHAGDRSVDFNWYTKRATLAGVYKSTELYMLQDRSENFQETWQFLDRRLDNLAQFGKFSRQLQDSGGQTGDLMSGALELARNVLGANNRNR